MFIKLPTENSQKFLIPTKMDHGSSITIRTEESMMKNMGGPAASGIDSSQMKEQMKRIGEMSPDELKTPLGYVAWIFFVDLQTFGGKDF